jgi:hypothetical protein
MQRNDEFFPNSPTPLKRAAASALRGFRDGDDSVSPVFDVARYAIKPAS